MTKEDLIAFLEPFSNDIKIFIYSEKHNYKNDGLADIHVGYRTAKNTSTELGIHKLEGYVVIL